jgi:hypothetical protein
MIVPMIMVFRGRATATAGGCAIAEAGTHAAAEAGTRAADQRGECGGGAFPA